MEKLGAASLPDGPMIGKESLRVILLDTRYHLLRMEEVSLGSVNESIAHPRDVFRPAVISSAYAVIVVHNHPSGDPSPSQSDHSLTRRLAEAAELLHNGETVAVCGILWPDVPHCATEPHRLL